MKIPENRLSRDNVTLNESETVTEVNDSLLLIQNKRALAFGTDALLLAAFIRPQKNASAAELGSGSGIIAMLCARRGKFLKIKAIELQPDLADIMGRNIALNGLDGIIEPICADIRLCDGSYDAVFSNPPYMKDGGGKSCAEYNREAARREKNGGITDFCRAAARILKYGGIFYTVYRPDRAADLICALRESGLEPKRIAYVYPDLGKEPCLMLTEAKKGAAPSLIHTKPLFLALNGAPTEEIKYIYENGLWFE